jgi:thiazole synthase
VTISGSDSDTPFKIGDKVFRSRLLMGTGKYPSFAAMRDCHEASGTEIVTLAVGRHDLSACSGANILEFLDRGRLTLLPNTAGAYTAAEAMRLARLAREALGTSWIKLEVLANPSTLWPDTEQTVAACRTLVREGFTVFPYTTDDLVVARRLEDEGAAAVMPLGSMIGSGLGVLNPVTLGLIKQSAKVPVIVDAGVGTASDAAFAMELGADGVLLNSSVAGAQDPLAMARAMGLAVEAGRLAFLAGRIPKKTYASPSSPGAGFGVTGNG